MRRADGALAVALALLAGTAAAAPRFPAPPGCSVGRVGDTMKFNGVPMEVRQIDCDGGLEAILDFYRDRWPKGTEKEPGYVVNTDMEPWTLLTRAEDKWLMTVQVTANGQRSTGYLSLTRLIEPEDLPELGKGFPMPHDSRVVNDVETTDPGKKGRTLMISNDLGLDSNVIFYRNWYKDRGWTVMMDKALGEHMHTFSFKNGGEGVNLVVVEGGDKTAVTAQLVEEGWW